MKDPLSKWGVFWIWEPIIKNHLLRFGMEFDELICVTKSCSNIYSGYFTVKDIDNDMKFGQLVVNFNKGRITHNILFWEEANKNIIQSIDNLLLDKRVNFPWLAR